MGVKTALADCHEKFVEAPARKQAAERAATQAAVWKHLAQAPFPESRKRLGAPDFSSEAQECSPLEGRQVLKGQRCVRHLWRDLNRSICARPGASLYDAIESACYLRLETVVGKPDEIWAWWPESY